MASDVHSAYGAAMEAGSKLGRMIEVKEAIACIVEQDELPKKFVKQVLGSFINK